MENETVSPFQQQLEKVGVEGLEKMQSYLQSAESFANEQVPLFIQEIIRWEIGRSIFFATIFTLVAIAVIVSFRIIHRILTKIQTKEGYGEFDKFSKCAVCVINAIIHIGLTIMFITFTCEWIYQICYVYLAPRVFLLEKISELINGTH